MITFYGAIDARCRDPDHPCAAALEDTHGGNRVYIVIGTDYGYLRRASGDAWAFKHASSARRKAREYALTREGAL